MTTAKTRFSWITAQADGAEHAVIDEAHVAGMQAGEGVFEAACGAVFLAACMDAGPRDRCSSCRAFVRARVELRDFDDRLTEYRRPGWLSRLFCHRKQPADVGSDTTTPPDAPTSAGTQKPSAAF